MDLDQLCEKFISKGKEMKGYHEHSVAAMELANQMTQITDSLNNLSEERIGTQMWQKYYSGKDWEQNVREVFKSWVTHQSN